MAPLPTLSAQTRLLVVSPHPDDESLAAGGLIQAVLAVGGTVDVLLVTDGDDNPWPQRWLERRLTIDAAARARWAVRRRGEVTAALERLGVTPLSLHALGWPDMGVMDRLREDHPAAVGAFAGVIEAVAPTLIALPALGDHHPDHGACHVLTRMAMVGLGLALPSVAYMVHGTDETSGGEEGSAATFVPVVSEPMREAKHAAVLEHRTQISLSRARMLRMAGRREAYTVLDPAGDLSGIVERGILPWRPSAALRPWLQLTVVDRGGVQVWPWSAAPLRHGAGGLSIELSPRPGPVFVKLSVPVSTPWIFDRWGWRELARSGA
jgi:N-acetyl-1-D-myo-inositol-2-amino-2-deoxy-alpha-D-glucopyranoside deacetylase